MRKLILSAVALTLLTDVALAASLREGYAAARRVDAQFQAAGPEHAANKLAAGAAYAAYLPTFSASQSKLEAESTTRRTYVINQPLFAADKAAAFLEGAPRSRRAEVVYQQREGELAQRYFKALSDWLKASEGLRLLEAKAQAFDQQYQSARRALEEGVGTVSERQDALLRVEQARSEAVALGAQQSAAAQALAYMTGQPPQAAWQLRADAGQLPALPGLDSCLETARVNSTALQQAQIDAELARVGLWKARGALLPSVDFVLQRTEYNGHVTNYKGVAINYPLSAGNALQALSADAEADRLERQARDAENKIALEVSRLHGLVRAGQVEVSMRARAIDTAQLAVTANQASYQGGVRSKTDVLNAIQALFQAKQDYVTARLNLADAYLNLMLLQAQSGESIFGALDRFLFVSGGSDA